MSETNDITDKPAPAPLPGSTSWEQLAALHPAALIEPGAKDPPPPGGFDPGDSRGVGHAPENAA